MFHSQGAERVLRELGSAEDGLSETEADARLRKYGYNEFGRGKRRTLLDIFLEQFRNYILLLLMFAAIAAYLIGHTTDALGIGIVVVLNVLFGMALEYRADQSMGELRKLAETRAVVLRNGKKYYVESRNLVPGDVIFLEEGGKAAADARLLEEHGLEMNEASLTGESMPVRKNVGKVAAETPLAERSCMAYAGTFVARGSARAVVVATGYGTEFGGIEKALGRVKSGETTLERALAELGKGITVASFAVVGFLFFVGLFFGKMTVEELFIYSIAVIVAAVPEGMLTILTIVLAIGVKNMAEEKALVRKLQSVETLGNITFIATDKTGTITAGRMALVKVYDGKVRDFAELSGTEKVMSYSYLCNGAHLTDEGVVGDETDRALVLAGIAKGANVRRFRQAVRQLAFFPFDSVKKSMAGIYEISGEKVAIVKGAPEKVLGMCSEFEGIGAMGRERRKRAMESLDLLTGEGMRVIGVAYGKSRGNRVPEEGLTFLGFLALHDPIRSEVRDTMRVCREAGIRVLMMTGDNAKTAGRIGAEIGLTECGRVANWSELDHLGDRELDRALAGISVVARATPASKLRIVERLVKQGEIVAVTGDGVNDAPALKKAHVGVVMGGVGTDVSREVADLVLMDDNFATLEKAVEYGRRIAANIMSFLRFQITTNIALVMLSVPYVLGVTLLQPLHILWVNLIIDGPPALTLGLERPGAGIMKEKPRKKTAFIDMEFAWAAFNMALFMAAMCAVVYFHYQGTAPPKTMTMVFTSFVLMQAFNVLNSRSGREHFYAGLGTNKWLVAAVLGVIALQAAIVTVQPLMELFGTVALSASDWVVAFVVALTVLVVGEARKIPFSPDK